MSADLRTAGEQSFVAAGEILGCTADFIIEQEQHGNVNVIRVTTVMPKVEWRGNYLAVFAPPRFPWKEAK